jgi:hypothetical protein
MLFLFVWGAYWALLSVTMHKGFTPTQKEIIFWRIMYASIPDDFRHMTKPGIGPAVGFSG